MLLEGVQILSRIGWTWRGLAGFIDVQRPLLTGSDMVPTVSVDQVLIMVLLGDLPALLSIPIFDVIATWASLDREDWNLFSDRFELRVIQRHAWRIVTFKVDFILRPIGLLCLWSH